MLVVLFIEKYLKQSVVTLTEVGTVTENFVWNIKKKNTLPLNVITDI